MNQELGKYSVHIIFQQIGEMWLYFTKKRNRSTVRLDTTLIQVQNTGASTSARLTLCTANASGDWMQLWPLSHRVSVKSRRLINCSAFDRQPCSSQTATFQRCWFSLLQHITQGLVKGISFGFSQTIGLDRQFLCNNCFPTFFYIYDFSFLSPNYTTTFLASEHHFVQSECRDRAQSIN